MKAVKASVVLLGLALGLTASAHAEKVAVSLDCEAGDGDTTGMQLCMELRDAIATSPRYREVGSDAKEIHWGLKIISILADDSKTFSAQSMAMTLVPTDGGEYFIDQWVAVTGRARVTNKARTLLAAFDQEVDTAKKVFADSAATQ